VLGAGPCGLLAGALLRQGGWDVITIDVLPETSRQAELARLLGTTYATSGTVPDGPPVRLLFDACGSPSAVDRLAARLGPTGGIVDFGIAEGAYEEAPGAHALRRTVGNHFRVGSINAGRDDWDVAAAAVARIAREHPTFFPRATGTVHGLDLDAMADALADHTIVKPVVFPT
jgi:threonine dehydrogenase-like Zn-dependent dehydrogenase